MAKKRGEGRVKGTGRATGTRAVMSLDRAIIAILIAAMDANEHVSREEAWRAHHIIWSMRRFRNQPGEKVDRLIDSVRTRMIARGKDAVLLEAVRVIPARLRPSAFAVAVDLMLADARLEAAEKRFVKRLAIDLKIEPERAASLVRAMVIKNTA
jgi:hypothetical protein